MSCILVTTDLSPAARAAYPHARRFARAYGLPIRLLHVVDRVYQFNAAEYGDSEDYLAQLTERRRKDLDAEADLLRQDGLTVKTTTILGRSIPDILTQASAARLLVMATHGYGGFRRFILGSVTSRVVQRSPIPVLVVNVEAEDSDYDRILLGTDLSEAATGALEQTIGLLAPLTDASTEIELFHADVAPSRVTVGRSERFEVPGASKDEYAAAVHARLAAMTAELAGHGMAATSHVQQSRRAAEALAERTEAVAANLLVVSSHGRGRLSVAWLGSTCDEVIRLTECPVLVVRPAREPFEG